MDYPVAKPPWTTLGKRLESLTRKAVYEYSLLEDKNKIAVALSGGKDSLSLLYLLKAISSRGIHPIDIHAIHISGKFSCGSGIKKGFLQGICNNLDVTFHSLEQEQDEKNLNCYSCSRKRRSLIFNHAKSLGIDTIAFGHHRDDSIQTLLMNLLHKAEFACNLPKVYMEKFGIYIIRPLIFIEEKDIITFSKQYAFNRVMCQCPIGQTSMRKKVNLLIDKMESLFPNTRKNLAHAGRQHGSDKALKP